MVVVSGNRYVSNGQVETGDVVLSGGTLVVYSGGKVVNTVVNSGGTSNNPGTLNVLAGGVASGTQLHGNESVDGLESGGTVFAGGSATVDGNGSALGVTVSGGGINQTSSPPNVTFIGEPTFSGTGALIDNGYASNTKINGGIEDVGENDVDSGASINSGGWQWVGGSAFSATVNTNSEQEVVGGGSATSTTLNNGSFQYVAGLANSTTINGGTEFVTGNGRSLGYASNTIVNNAGSQVVADEGSVDQTTLNAGGSLTVSSAGFAAHTTVGQGAIEYVSSGGNAFTTTVNAGGQQIVYSGGNAGREIAGGIQGHTTLESGATQILSGGAATNTTIEAGATETVLSGGVAVHSILSGGTQIVAPGGIAISTTIVTGTEVIQSGGILSGVVVSGGTLDLADGAITSGGSITLAGSGSVRVGGTSVPTISGFAVGNTIDLKNVVAYDAIQVGSKLEVLTSGGPGNSPLVLPVSLAANQVVSIASDGKGGTKITASPKGGGLTATISNTADDSGNHVLTAAQIQLVDNAIQAAIAQYGKHFGGKANLNIQLTLVDFGNADSFAVARTPVWVSTGQTDPTNGALIYQTGAAWKLNNPGTSPWDATGRLVNPNVGVQPNGKPDIVIGLNVNAAALAQMDLNNDPQAPPNQALIYNLIMHELGHAFGIASLTAANLSPNVESAFDSYIVPFVDPFTGQTTYSFSSAPGIDVPIAVGSDGVHLGLQLQGDEFSPPVGPDLMSSGGINYLFGAPKLDLSPTDLAIFAALDPAVYGDILIPAGTTFELTTQDAAFAGETVGFVNSVAAAPTTLKLDIPLTGVIDGLVPGDTIDLAYLTSTNFGTGANNLRTVWVGNSQNSGGTLSIVDPSHGSTAIASLLLNGNYSASQFVVLNDGASHPLIAWKPSPPTLAVTSDGSATHGQQLALSALVTISDLSHVGYQKLELWDSNGTVAGGEFKINGVAQTGGHEIDVLPANVANVEFDVATAGGTDTLWAQLQQNDGTLTGWQQFTVTAPADRAPVVTVSNLAAARGQSLAASTMFSVSDADGDAITQYALWDTEGHGHFVVNGAVQATNAEIDVTAAQLAQTIYQSGSGTDTLYVRANDGAIWGAWSSGFTVTTPVNHAPVLTASNAAIASGHSVSASSLFTASDPDGNSIATYALWDSNTNGHFSVNGLTQAANSEIDLTAAQLAHSTYVAGNGTDQLYVRVNDGSLWSNWQAFTAGPMPPVVTAANAAIASGHSVAASSLFIASDPDGGSIATYALWDSNTNGHFAVGGVSKAANTEIDVTAAQLAQTTYVAGNGTDQLDVRVNNGLGWSNWTAFTAGPVLPQVTAPNAAIASGHSVAASSLFTASDPDGGTLTTYAFWDSSTNGHFAVNGASKAANTEIDVTAAQLAQTTYVAGGGTDQLYVRVNNGISWSNWNAFTAGPVPPVTTASNLTTVPGQTLAASNLFVAGDPDGGTLTTYAFWDSNTNGHFAINGVAQAANTEIDVTASQLAATTYVSGNGTDQLYVRASDGTAWSNWQAFTATGSTPAIINNGASLELGSAFPNQVTFFGSTGTLRLDNSASFNGTVAGMTANDSIDFADINFATIQTPTFHNATAAGGTLTVTDGTHTANIALLGNYLASTFIASGDGHGGTSVIDPPAGAALNLLAAQHS